MESKRKFGLIQRITNTGKILSIPPLIDNDIVISDPLQKSETFNAHFASKSTTPNSFDPKPIIDQIDTMSNLANIYTSNFEL